MLERSLRFAQGAGWEKFMIGTVHRLFATFASSKEIELASALNDRCNNHFAFVSPPE